MREMMILACVLAAACGPAARDDRDAGSTVDGGGSNDPNDPNNPGDPPLQTFVYAQTATTLYRVDPDTLAIDQVGDFTFTSGRDDITDIAIDKSGLMIGISFGAVYRIDTNTAAATLLSDDLQGNFNGLSFVPADQLGQTGDDVLVATRNSDGVVFRVDPQTGAASPIGDMAGFASSGDLVSVAMLGTLQTADNGFDADRLVRLAPQSFQAQPIGSTIGFSDIWGIAYWKDRVFGFTKYGEFVTIDPSTGQGTLVQGNGPAWWGAAVTTLAPVVL
jgi:hypothetical protein